MARPARFDEDELLDRGVALAAAGGPAAVTMAAVARAAGAPSGSLYHRFPSRAALLAALWLRTVERFQDGWHATVRAAAAAGDARDGCAAAARFTVAWSRAHADEARVLLHGASAFDRPAWPAETRRRAAAGERALAQTLGALARGLGRDDAAGRERVAVATIDVPYALVRRHLRAGRPIPHDAGDLVAEVARALLA